jgi:hypothetical protein
MALTMKPVASRSQLGEAEFSLQECPAVAELPATDIDRARRFYAEQLGLTSSPGAAPGHHLPMRRLALSPVSGPWEGVGNS